MQIGVRVSVEAAATVARIVATLFLLWAGVATEAVSLSLAQVSPPPPLPTPTFPHLPAHEISPFPLI